MNDKELVRAVREEAGLDSDDHAQRCLTATVAAIASRLTYGAAHDLTDYLPSSLRPAILNALEPMAGLRFRPVDDLYEELALKLRIAPAEAVHRVQAVARVLAGALPAEQLHEVRGQLPKSLRGLFDQPSIAR